MSETFLIQLIKYCFYLGAITDGLAFIVMSIPRIGTKIFGGKIFRNNWDYRFSMGIGSSLMIGWTILLIWGSFKPIERCDLLIITVFPVISGIVFSTIYATKHNVIPIKKLIPLWIHLSILSSLYVITFILSRHFR